MQVDDDDEPNYTNDGGIAEVRSFNGADYQKWIFTNAGDGYYKITSKISGYAVTVPSGEESEENIDLVLKPYTGSNNQKWKITLTSYGSYKIKAKSSESITDRDLVMVVQTNILYSEGLNIRQRQYSDNTSYKDEWYIRSTIKVGMSTDNYTDGCPNGVRDAYRYANVFYNTLTDSQNDASISKVHHYNKGTTRTASKNDFSVNGAISNDVDFMIYIGHGHAAENSNGNYLHYNCAPDGSYHSACGEATYNVYTSDVRFGSDESKLRWVWLYTCNFLTTNGYVTDNTLKGMMTGAHIVMGYASKATLCDAMSEKFAEYLYSGKTIINAYFLAGHNGEASVETANHYQRVLYIPQAENETIYSPKMYYEYDSSDVLTVTKNIQD